MAYATSLAAELRKRRMQLELRTPGDVRPRRMKNWNQSAMTGSGSAEEPVIIIDDLSSPEDEGHPIDAKSTEPDAKKQKVESSEVGAGDHQALPRTIVDDALLSAIPMPSIPVCASSIPMPAMPPPAAAVTVERQCSPVVAEEKPSPLPAVLQEQHSTPVDEQKTSPASIDQTVFSGDVSYAFRRLTELPMPPTVPDDECESLCENVR